MRKNYNQTDLHQKEGQEQSKRLYRSISEHVRRLDDARSSAGNVEDLFTPPLQILRSKFKDYCERLIFSDPAQYGRKGEELLWRKAFYEVVATAKRLKNQQYTIAEKCSIQAHISSGIGFYHHYLSRLQTEFDFNLNGIVDFSIVTSSFSESKQTKTQNAQLIEWASLSAHRTLIYLGDLCRYRLEIYPNWDMSLAIRYYSQAAYYRPEIGMPHNQMGTLATNFNLNHSLDAAYHYIRCLTSKIIFEGTENNLYRLFEKNSKFLEQLPVETQGADSVIRLEPSEHIKQFISRFLLLTDIWFFSKNVPHIYNLCHQINIDLRDCLAYVKPVASDVGDGQVDIESIDSVSYVNSDILFRMSAICLMCISKLQAAQSHQLSNVVAFSLALYSQLIQHIIGHIHDGILNAPVPSEELITEQINGLHVKTAKKSKRRRRKVKTLSDESDLSENEEDIHACSSDESCPSDVNLHSSSSEDEEDVKTSENNKNLSTLNHPTCADKIEANLNIENKSKEELITLSKRLDVNDMLEIIAEEQILQSVKILSDWFSLDVEVIKSCGKTTRSLFNQIIHLINLINININNQKLNGISSDIKEIKESSLKIALNEDVILKGVDILAGTHAKIDWKLTGMREVSHKEEALTRTLKLVSFAHFLATIPETGVVFDEQTNLFSVKSSEDEPSISPPTIEDLENAEIENGPTIKKPEDSKKHEGKGQLSKMKHMGQLWLAAEVRELESRVRGKTALSPYLVIDVDCLVKYTAMVRQLVFSRKFIVLVPTAVVSALDELKKEKMEARDAIRWLENQFHHGNRFFRAQRPQERLPLPFIKYPKKKDKDATIYIQIVECCHYLAEQQKGASNLVTLLMGSSYPISNGQNKDISYVGLANSAGVNLELITEFYGKWKKSVKGKR